MAYLIIWSKRAVEDLDEIATYISRDSEQYAKSVLRTILAKTRKLAEFPYIGRVVAEFDDESVREIFAYSDRIVYRVGEAQIDVAAVIHGRRQLELSLRP